MHRKMHIKLLQSKKIPEFANVSQCDQHLVL